MPSSAIKIRGLRAGYRARQVLGPLTLELRERETSTFLGPCGAGKSTLLRILHRSADSDIWCRGYLHLPDTASRFCSQKPKASPDTLGERLQNQGGDRDPATAISSIWSSVPEAAAYVETLVDVPLSSLAREQFRIAWLTLALAGNPALVLLDEPDADLEGIWFSWVYRLLVSWRRRTTLILATHHLELARDASDHVFLLVGGKLVESAPTSDLFDRPVHPRTRDFLRMGS